MPELPYGISLLYAASALVLLGYAAWRDLLTRTIPDKVSIALLGLGLATRMSESWSDAGMSLVVAVALFICLVPLCARGILGGADLKLLTALSAGLTPAGCLHLLLAVTAAGGCLAALYLVAGSVVHRLMAGRVFTRQRSAPRRVAAVELWRIRRRAPLPYGVAIALGMTVIFLRLQGA